MMRLGYSAVLMVLWLVATGCGSAGPTTPSRASASFSVTGIVTDDQGAPVGAATVTVRHWLHGEISAPSVETDASGRYTIGFTADTAGTTGMQAEIFDLAGCPSELSEIQSTCLQHAFFPALTVFMAVLRSHQNENPQCFSRKLVVAATI